MKDLSKKILAGSLLCIAVATTFSRYFPQKLFAQNDSGETFQENIIGLTAVPDRLGADGSVMVKPGDKKQIQVRIINPSNTPITVSSKAKDFIVQEDGATPVQIETPEGLTNRWSLASWLVLTPTEQLIGPRQTVVVNALIEVPQDALPGGHYAMITHMPTLGLNSSSGSTTGINQEVGTLLYVTVEGPINEEAYITDFTMPEFSEFGPVPYSFTIDNRSDIHISPQIGITIKNMFGQTVEIIQPESKNVFPLTSRKFEGKWERIWGFGRYRAELVMSFGTQGKIVIAYANFWLLPVKLLMAAVVCLLALIAMSIAIRRHIIHRNQDQSQKIADLERKLQDLEKDKLQKYEE